MDIIACIDKSNGIGYRGKLPWNIPSELKHFSTLTNNSVLIVGRKTAESLPLLKNRIVICLSHFSLKNDKNNCILETSIDGALKIARERYPDKKVFVAGGENIYKQAIIHPCTRNIHLSVLNETFTCDTFFPDFNIREWPIFSQNIFPDFTYKILKFSNNSENQYLDLISDVMKNGTVRKGRNGETKSLFGKQLSFDLTKGFPLLTTRKMFFRGILEEFLFFLRGETDSKILENKGVNIWKGNTSREFLDNLEMTKRREGLMGPMYGYNWRFFGAEYDEKTGNPVCKEKGFDQLRYIINTIKTDPTSRRLIMTTYDPFTTFDGVLFPCHDIVTQFYVDDKFLDMYCYNRSQDIFHGTAFNIPSSALLLVVIAKLTGLIPRMLHIGMGDTHIYESHYESVKKLLSRHPYVFPNIFVADTVTDIDNIKIEDFKLVDYRFHESISVSMVV
jgi:dihydrofolate reductase / thymidylate synthase